VYLNCSYQKHFQLKKQQIPFGGGALGSLQRSLQTPSWIKGSLVLREKYGKEVGEGREVEERRDKV